MFLNMTIYYVSLIYYGEYTYKEHLPLHFCFIAGYLFMYTVLTKNEKLYKLVYFFAFMGPLPAMIWPDLKSSFDAFIFYQFILSHHLFLILNFYIFYSYEHDFSKKDILKALIVSNIYFGLIYIFNLIFGTNYIMQKSLPEHILRIYPWIYTINYPIILLEITGTLVCFIAYVPIYFKNRERKKYRYINEKELIYLPIEK